MKTFRIQADAKFQAEDIDDAFRQLAIYFEGLYAGNNYENLRSGTIDVHEIDTGIES